MNAADWKRSARLRRVLEVLSDGAEHSTWEVQMAAHVCVVAVCVAELRQNGFPVECRRLSGGGLAPVWVYQMASDDAARAREALAELEGGSR